MKTFLAPLIWKEYRERRLMLGLNLAWMLLWTMYSLAYEVGHRFRGPVASFHGTASLFTLLAGVLVAMRTARGETTDRTRGFSDSLPIPALLRAAVRLVGGVFVLAAPIAAGALLLSVTLGTGMVEQTPPVDRWAESEHVRMPERPSLSRGTAVGMAWYVAALEIASASWLLLMATAVGTIVRSESRAGYAAAAAAAVTLLLSSSREMLQQAGATKAAAWACALVPSARTINFGYQEQSGTYFDIDFGHKLGWTLQVNVLLQFLLALWLIRRMAAMVDRQFVSDEGRTPRRIWIPRLLPLPTRGLALSWLAARHALPMAIPGIVFALAITTAEWLRVQSHVEIVNGQPVVASSEYGGQTPELFANVMSHMIAIVGAIWCVVVGAGLFASESDSRIGEFWRTRPIGGTGLFMMKFLVGLGVTLLVLDVPAIVLSWGSPDWGRYHAMNWPHVAIIIPLHATLFAVAVGCTCLTRHAAIGGVLTFVLIALSTVVGSVVPALDPIYAYEQSRFTDRGTGWAMQNPVPPDMPLLPATYPWVLLMLVMVTAASMAAGASSLRRYRPILRVGN